ncbi:MAG: hypothetical protein GY853_08345 [PVC group bacterium]|nr:hypothetical protein [PVC group bacterium]
MRKTKIIILFVGFIYVMGGVAAGVQADELKDLKERVLKLEEQIGKGGSLTKKGLLWKLSGELELEFVDTQSDASIDETKAHFQVDKFALAPTVYLEENINFYGNIEFTTDGASVAEAYLDFINLPLNSRLRTGYFYRFIEIDRKTEKHCLAGNGFWRDGSMGIMWKTEQDSFYGIASLTHGQELNTKQVGEDSSYKIIHDNMKSDNYVGIRELGLGLGVKQDLEQIGSIDVLGFSYLDKLSLADITFLQANVNGYTSNDDKQQRNGVNLTYFLKEFTFISQYIASVDGKLKRNAWILQPSYKFDLPLDWKHCKSHELLVRYGAYNVNTSRVVALPTTWDREELTIALITNVAENIKLKTEYSINAEKTGGSDVKNNEIVIQLETKF